MKSNITIAIVFFWILLGCQNMDKKQDINSSVSSDKLLETEIEEETETSSKNKMLKSKNGDSYSYDPKTTLYFSHAFIYEYWNEDNKEEHGEFWIYHSPETGNLLYVPDDEMVDFVVSDPKGNYYYFGTEGHGANTVSHQAVDWVADITNYNENEVYPISDDYIHFKKTGQKFELEDGKIDGKPIVGEEFQWEFQRVSGYQTTAVTEMIPVNFYQVYGFNKLDGDIQLPVVFFDFIGIFGKNQTVTHFQSEQFRLELKAYQFNPYYAEAGDYDYYISEGVGKWKKTHLPLLEK